MQTGNVILDRKDGRSGTRRFGVASLTILPAFVIAFLPKCPLCLLGVLGAIGLSLPVSANWLFPFSPALNRQHRTMPNTRVTQLRLSGYDVGRH